MESEDRNATTATLINRDSPSGTLKRNLEESNDEYEMNDGKVEDDVDEMDYADGGTSAKFQRFDTKDKDHADCEKKTMYKVQLKNSRYYFQHPYCRLLVAYIIVFFNFLIFAEDPVSHSVIEAELPVIGNDVGFIIYRYPPGGWALLKVILFLTAIAVGMCFGKFIVHKRLLVKTMKLRMFQDCQGSWMIMFLTVLLTLFIFSYIFNGFLRLGSGLSSYELSSFFGISNENFMKFAALGTWTGDFVTAWMVTDIMLQERLYPSWAVFPRSIWRRKWHRIIAFWTVWILATLIVATGITTDFVKWDNLNRDFVSTNELSRAFLASVILVMDLLIVMQDWDFPHFQSDIDVKLPGVDTSSFHFTPPRFLKEENWAVHVTGKWFNYGVIVIVMILDLNMWKNQIFYDPFTYGQYTDSSGYIYTVSNESFVRQANKTTLSYEWRWNNIDPATNRSYGESDLKMNSKYLDYSLGLKSMAFIPSIATFIVFGLFVWIYGREKAVAVVSEPCAVDGVVIDQWEEETSNKPDQEERSDPETGIQNTDNDRSSTKLRDNRPASGIITVEENDKTQPVLTSYEKTLSH